MSKEWRAAARFAGLDAFEGYRALYASGADVEALNSDVYAEVEARVAGSLVFSRRTLHNVVHSRDTRRVRRGAFDHLTLSFVHDGELDLQTERDRTVVRSGSVLLLDTTRPSRHMSRARTTTVSFPRALLPAGLSASGRLHGLKLSGREADPLLWWLTHVGDDPTPEADLATALCSALQQTDPSSVASMRRRDRQDRVREAIEAGLADQTLTPERIASTLGLSRATLYRAFEPLGSIERWRQGRRLWRLKAALAFTDQTVAEAAYGVGFEAPAHASALFTKVYGTSPTAFRQGATKAGQGGGRGTDLAWIFDNIAMLIQRSDVALRLAPR